MLDEGDRLVTGETVPQYPLVPRARNLDKTRARAARCIIRRIFEWGAAVIGIVEDEHLGPRHFAPAGEDVHQLGPGVCREAPAEPPVRSIAESG